VILAPGGENPVGQFPRGVEVGCLQRGEGRGKIDETAPSRAIEQTKRAGHFEATRARNGDAGPVVHENEIGVKLRGQRNGGALAIVQSGKGGILVGDRFGDDGEPRGRCRDPVPDRFRRLWAVELVAHDGGDPHALEHPRQQIDVADQHQVVQRACIRDDDAHASETEPVQRLSVAFKFGQCHAFIDAVRFEEAVEFGAGLEPEQAAQFGSRQPAGAIFLEHERFQGAARQVGLGAEPGGQRIGNGQRDVHGGSLARRRGGCKFTHDKGRYHAWYKLHEEINMAQIIIAFLPSRPYTGEVILKDIIIMPHAGYGEVLPRDAEALADAHAESAAALAFGLQGIGEALDLHFGEARTRAAFRALLVDAPSPRKHQADLQTGFDKLGWRTFLAEMVGVGREVDTLEHTKFIRDALAYAGQGLAPSERPDVPSSVTDRRKRIQALVDDVRKVRRFGHLIYGQRYDFVWKAVAARAALDSDAPVPIDGLQLLPGVSVAAVRNAISAGDLHLDEDETNIPYDEAKSWLARRRAFQPSRWKDLTDDQWPFDPTKATAPDERGMILIPQSADGVLFLPKHVVRGSPRGSGVSITIGPKGDEVQYDDFYEALAALAKADVARWRRRNSVGNWGIVRARGAWVAFQTAEIDRQLAGYRMEGL
jgi:hypothetical protein